MSGVVIVSSNLPKDVFNSFIIDMRKLAYKYVDRRFVFHNDIITPANIKFIIDDSIVNIVVNNKLNKLDDHVLLERAGSH